MRPAGTEGRFVAEHEGTVVGWAALSPVSSRPCYAGRGREQRLRRRVGPGPGRRHRADGGAHGRLPRQQGSGRSRRACSRRTPPASRCTSGPVSASSGRRERIAELDGVWRDTLFLELRLPRLDLYIELIYRDAAYGNRGHPGHSRPPLDRPPLRLRDQGRRRPLDPLLLGGELQPDLPGASPARA